MKAQRGATIRALIERLRHEGIGDDELYDELAERLSQEHTYNRVFHDAFASQPPSQVEAEHLRRFYEDFMEGVYDVDEGAGAG
jgi:hypothetical protein